MREEGEQLSSTWPKKAGRRKSSTLFHRTNGGSGAIDVADVRGPFDEEEGRGEGGDAIHDEDSPSPPRIPRRPFTKRGGGGVSAARRNGALCLALCVSAASLVWIIARDETGPASAGLQNLGQWANGRLSTGMKRPPASVKVESVGATHNDSEQVSAPRGQGGGVKAPKANLRRAPEEQSAEQRRQPEPEQPPTDHRDKFMRRQEQQQQQSQQREDAAAAVVGTLVARDAAEVTLRAAISESGFIPAAKGEHGSAAKANADPNHEVKTVLEEMGLGRRSEPYNAAAASGGFGESPVENFAKTRRADNGEQDGFVPPPARRDVAEVGKWGAFEDVPVPVPVPVAAAVGGEIGSQTAVTEAAPAIEGGTLPNGNIGGVGSATEERPPNHEAEAGAPSGGTADAEGPAGSGGSRAVGGVPDEAKSHPKAEGGPPTVSAAVASGELEGEKGSQQRGQGARAERQQEEAPAAGVSGNGSAAEASTETPPTNERPKEGEEGNGAGEEIRVESESPAAKDEHKGKEGAVGDPRAAGSSNTNKSKEGETVTSGGEGHDSADSRDDEIFGIREARKRAQDIRSSTRRRPVDSVEQASPEQPKPVVVVERADVKPPSRHADRWEQARKSVDGGGDKSSAIARSKQATGAAASMAAVEFAARESASVARGVASAKAAAEAALVGVPPLFPSGGGSFTTGGGGGGGERGGARGGGEGGGEALPCRLEGRVEDWKPPAIADLRTAYRWADEQKASMDRIRRFRQGGTALRELIHTEVMRLDILRHDLFC